MWGGKEFHILGAEIQKAWEPLFCVWVTIATDIFDSNLDHSNYQQHWGSNAANHNSIHEELVICRSTCHSSAFTHRVKHEANEVRHTSKMNFLEHSHNCMKLIKLKLQPISQECPTYSPLATIRPARRFYPAREVSLILGGAKGFSLTSNISLTLGNFTKIFQLLYTSPWPLQIPPTSDTNSTSGLGPQCSPPQKKYL